MKSRSTVKKLLAALSFFPVAIFMVEFLTGNAPLTLLLDPLPLVALSVSYGGGALLIRELVKRWGRGFPSILLLGVTYGIVNEGLNSGGFFDPRFYAVVAAGVQDFARWGEINVFWSFNMTVIHAVFSITIPILIVDVLFGERERLLGKKTFVALIIIFVLDSVFLTFIAGKIFAPRPAPDLFAYILVLIIMVLFVIAARVFPRSLSSPLTAKPRPVRFFIAGGLGSAAFFLTFLKLHEYVPSPAVNLLVSIGLVILFAAVLLRLPELADRDRVALAAGAEFMFIFSAIQNDLIIQALGAIALLMLAWFSTLRRKLSAASG